jgi:hypothetical protein
MIELGLKVTLAYLVGSVLGSLFVGFFYGGVDIRKAGSGNAGGTNALRTQGKVFALWVMIIDIGKGILAAVVIPPLVIPGVGIDAAVDRSLVLTRSRSPRLSVTYSPFGSGSAAARGVRPRQASCAGSRPRLA